MEFISKTCPQCGGEIKIKPRTRHAYCMYCGSKLTMKSEQQRKSRKKAVDKLQNYIRLANEALESGKTKEAMSYAKKVLEMDATISDAWYVKMHGADTVQELINCASNVIDYSNENKRRENVERVWALLQQFIVDCFEEATKKCNDFYHIKMQYNHFKSVNSGMASTAAIEHDTKFIDSYTDLMSNAVMVFETLLEFDMQGYDEARRDLAEYIALKYIEFYRVYNYRLAVYKAHIHEDAIVLQRKQIFDIVKILYKEKQEELLKLHSEIHKKKKGACYIATTVYGSYDDPNVMVLRDFRDNVLQPNVFGRMFIKTYYKLSPPFANRLKNWDSVNKLIKSILDAWVNHLKGKYNY